MTTTITRPLRRLMIGLAVVSTLAAAGCSASKNDGGSAPATTSEAQIDTVTFATQSPPRSMDIAHGADYPSQRAITAAFDRVLAMDNSGKAIPWVAESWTQPNPTTYVFKLRPGITFWDGTPLTSEDVAFSLERHLDPKLGSEVAGIFSLVKSVVATDDSTVTVKLTAPSGDFLYRAAIDWTVIQKKYSTEAGADLGTPKKPGMGTGPYSITSYSTADGVTLERYDGYWGDAPKVKTLVVKAIEDPENARLALLSGDIGGYFDVPLIATRKFETVDDAYMTYVGGTYIDLLSMNVNKAPFDDPKVREAVAHLMDREGLNKPLFNDKAILATSIIPAGQIDATYGAEGSAALQAALPPVPGFDVEAAKAALAASSHPEGFTVTLPVDTTQPWMLPLAQNLAENAKPLGIVIEPKPVSSAAWADGLFAADRSPLQLVALGAASPYISLPADILGDGAISISEYSTPELLTQLATSKSKPQDDEAGAANMSAILSASNSSLAYQPLFDEQAALALSNDLVWDGGYSPWALGQVWPMFLRAAK